MIIKTIIFDLDGTLYPRTSSLYQSMSASIRRWFQNQLRMNDSDFGNYFEQMKLAYPSPLEAIQVLGFSVDSFHSEVFGGLHPKQHLAPDQKLRLMLNSLPVEKFIVTLASHEHVVNVLKALDVESCFSDIIVPGSGWDTTSKFGAYEVVRKQGGWKTEDVYIVGDDIRIDLMEACAAGYRCISVFGGAQWPDVERIESIYELETIIRKSLGTKKQKGVQAHE